MTSDNRHHDDCQRAVLVVTSFDSHGVDPLDTQEMAGLVRAMDVQLLFTREVRVRKVSSAFLLSSGHVAELKAALEDAAPDLVVFDAALSPVQQRNLERKLAAKVIDRTGVILEIFGLRARSAEGRLQVEMAQLLYLRSRLVRSWTHLERQRGGVGFLAGPGESQLESDRRALDKRIARNRRRIKDVRRVRLLQRRRRLQRAIPGAALIGYTNTGKSTLFNRLTGEKVVVADMPFATLDPHVREIVLPSRRRLGLIDTVGFISDLPTHLIASFRATIEQVMEADLLIHVRDAAHPQTDRQATDVMRVLERLERDTGLSCPPIIDVWNKSDRLDEAHCTGLAARGGGSALLVSAVTGAGVDDFCARVDKQLSARTAPTSLLVRADQGDERARLHRLYEIVSEQVFDNGDIRIEAIIPAGQDAPARSDAARSAR